MNSLEEMSKKLCDLTLVEVEAAAASVGEVVALIPALRSRQRRLCDADTRRKATRLPQDTEKQSANLKRPAVCVCVCA